MALDNNQFDGHGDIAQFLEKFKEQTFSTPITPPVNTYSAREDSIPAKPAQYERSFEKLEQKIRELEERFEASASQNQLILSELARTREALDRQKDRDAFFEHISRTIANLKASVESLSRAQQEQRSFREPDVQRSFDPVPSAFGAPEPARAVYHFEPSAQQPARLEREEKERIISSLKQKASQLKAVNSALDREIKKVQQEKMEALKKSAEQAKEILSLRDRLTAAEERFKSFDFEGRIISIKQQYQQKVSSLENQLQEISDTCMKQVEEIESLKAENLKLHKAAAEKDEALARLEAKERELTALKAEIATLQTSHSEDSKKQLASFTEKLQALETQRDGLQAELTRAQESLNAVRQEKETLENNFKELLAKINENDAVIAQLKAKIEVLGQQNEELAHHNEELSHQNAELKERNESLTHYNAALTSANQTLTHEKDALAEKAEISGRERAALAEQAETLSREKEELVENVAALSREKAGLAEHTENLNKEKESLTARAEMLAREKDELTARAAELEREKELLTEQAAHLAREKEELERRSHEMGNAKEALSGDLAAIHQEKDTLAGNLAQANREKESLAARAENLMREKEALADSLAQLNREKQNLAENLEQVERKKEALAGSLAQVNKEKQDLSLQSAALKQRAERLEGETKELAKENQQLRNQSAALLAARLVQEKERAKEETLNKASQAHKPQPPVFPRPPAPATREQSAVSSPAKKTLTEADLPEIKVAEPIAQPEALYDGEDFLTKTDSFIGRMKWSIFREDK